MQYDVDLSTHFLVDLYTSNFLSRNYMDEDRLMHSACDTIQTWSISDFDVNSHTVQLYIIDHISIFNHWIVLKLYQMILEQWFYLGMKF